MKKIELQELAHLEGGAITKGEALGFSCTMSIIAYAAAISVTGPIGGLFLAGSIGSFSVCLGILQS